MPRLILLGVGPAESSRFAPAGLLIEYGHTRVGIDGGPGSEPPDSVQVWLVRDETGPLQAELRRIARESEMPEPKVDSFRHGPLHVDPVAVDGRLHGYRIAAGHHTAVWLPEPPSVPDWVRDCEVMFADAAGRSGEPPDVPAVAKAAERLGVRRLVFARLGDPVLAAVDAGDAPPYGEWGVEGRVYRM